MSSPTIFLSAATDDLKEWRDLLHEAFSRADCKVYTQNQSLGASSRDVPHLLREHLDKSDYVIHLAGLAYGAEPENPAFPDHPGFRCSYTQFEYYYAHLNDKHVIAFVCAPDFPYSPFTEKGRDDADIEKRRQLQIAHRKRVTEGYFIGTPLEGTTYRPLSRPIADTKALLAAVASVVAKIHNTAPTSEAATAFAKAHEELVKLANERFDELQRNIKDLPAAVGEYLKTAGHIRETTFRADISRIVKYAPANLIGREAETKILTDAWAQVQQSATHRPHVIAFVALGGEGKTSLVAKWAAQLSHDEWPGCDAAFAWSFYSQGTREQLAASSDLFLKEALIFFGDTEMAESSRGAFDKGRRLAQLVGAQRSLLILDGLEPLQYAPTSPMPGQLKDQGLSSLLKGLAGFNRGLCVVTTRYSVPDLHAYWQTTAPEVPLLRLSKEAGVALLRSLGVKGRPQEFETLVEDVKGHALTLNLLGTFLHDAYGGDIRKRDRIHLEEADAEEQGGHAFRVMDAYVRWFEEDGEKGKRALAVLRLLGLFDRPATADCIGALQQAPAISELTEPLVGMSEAQQNMAFSRLEAAKLLTVIRDAGTLVSLDAHPLIREYFARQMRTKQIEAWRFAHKRLYEHLCTATPDKRDPKLEDLQPIYQAIGHGCEAGLQQEVFESVYIDRTLKGTNPNSGFYSVKKIGAFGADLGAVACFFQAPWRLVSPSLAGSAQAWLLNQVAVDLRALGRLLEAIDPAGTSLELNVKRKRWENAASGCGLLCRLRLTLGQLSEAVKDAENALTYSDRSGNEFEKMISRSNLGDVLHKVGRLDQALEYFQDAEPLEYQLSQSPYLLSWAGAEFCDLLLSNPERAAWQVICGHGNRHADHEREFLGRFTSKEVETLIDSCQSISHRATHGLRVADRQGVLLDIGRSHRTLCCTELCTAILSSSDVQLKTAVTHADQSVDYLRRAGDQSEIPGGLLTRAWIRALTNNLTGPDSAQSDLDEAYEIAETGPMRLHLADIHLHRARLFFRRNPYPWTSPEADLAAAETLINDCGYHRRDAELADAKLAILGHP